MPRSLWYTFREQIFVCAFLVIVLFIAWLALNRIESQTRRGTGFALQTVLETTEEALLLWQRQGQAEIMKSSSHSEVLKATKELLAVPQKKQKSLLTNPALADIRSFFQPRVELFGELDFFIISPDFINIASKHDANLGAMNVMAKQRSHLLDKVFQGETLLIRLISSDLPPEESSSHLGKQALSMFIATPIRSESSKIIAVLAIAIDPSQDFTRITQFGRIGNSGETYGFDEQGYLITESRFDEHLRQVGLLKDQERGINSIKITDPGGNMLLGFKPALSNQELPLTFMAASATAGESGINVDGYRDYRGVMVLGTWLWNEELGIGLTTEIDADEALLPYYDTRNTILVGLGITAFLSLFLSTSLVRMRKGSIVNLQQTNEILEKRVEERTVKLEQANLLLKKEIVEGKETEAALKESQERYSGILALAGDGIISIDQKLRITLFNQSAEKIFGYQAKEVIGLPLEMLLPARFRSLHPQHIHDFGTSSTDARKMGERKEIFGRRKDGVQFFAEASISCLRQRGQITYTVIIRDITERKLTEKQLRENKLLLEEAQALGAIGSWEFDISSQKMIWSKQLFELFERDLALAPLTIEEKIASYRDGQRLEEAFQMARAYGKSFALDMPIQLESQQVAYHQVRGKAIKDEHGQVVKLRGTIQDITSRKQVEEELKQAKNDAEAANQAKSIFLSNMSHELRTPLNAILGFTQIMARDDSLSTKQRENLSIINRSGEHLLSLINDVLNLSKIEAGRVILEERDFDLYDTLNDLYDMFSLRAESKSLQLIFEGLPDVPGYIRSDEKKLRQVLINLLNNAIKFTSAGQITLRVSRTSSHDTLACRLDFEVEDTGVGIAPEEMGQLFLAFVQTESGRKSQEGTGLGLAISQQFVRLMGGEISVSSEVGQGSSFKFEIPVQVVESNVLQTRCPTRRVIGCEGEWRILVVDDRIENRALLRQLLSDVGFDVQEAANGKQAIALWEIWQPHLIWMDMRMPVLDGYQATRQIKSHSKGKATTIIALTATVLEEELNITLAAGCDDFVRKPFHQEDIFDKMQEHLGVRLLYEEIGEPTVEEPEQLTSISLAILPAEWRATLRRAVYAGDVLEILDLISEIEGQHAPLAAALNALANEYEFEKLLDLTAES